MINHSSIRRKSKEIFEKVIVLRKQGFSYSEIRRETGVAKTTINNWLTLAGLTLTREHLLIQAKKRLENNIIATEASKITRLKRKEESIQKTLEIHRKYFKDPFYNYGVAIYESEGSKGTDCKFSNSDYRLIQVFLKFVEKYFSLERENNMTFAIYIHETRKDDLEKIMGFWTKVIRVPKDKIKVYWKRNKVVGRRYNPDYVGQMAVRVKGERILGSKISAISDIILRKFQRD